MLNDAKNKKRFLLDKFLVVSAIICITFAVLIIEQYLSNTEIFANNANQMKTNYSSTESNTWDISENQDGSVIATLSDDGTLTISGEGNMKGWPNLSNLPWYSIRNQINKVKIENGVNDIGYRAFYDCNNLTIVEIPSSVTSIGEDAFYGCGKLISAKIPDGVTSIGDSAFFDCKRLTSIEIPSSVTSISDSAFGWCDGLINIYIPNSVTSIGYGVFEGCNSLISINVDKNNSIYKDDNGVLYTKDGTEIIGYPGGKKDEEYKILSGVITIGDYAFYDCDKLISIEIPYGVTNIGSGAFEYCDNLKTIKIPNSVINIGGYVFSSCSNLTNIEIPDSVKSLGDGVFAWCYKLISIEIPKSVTNISDRTFGYCSNLTSIKVDENNIIYKDNDGVLYSKDGTKIITYPGGKENEEYKILSGVTTIGDHAFDDCDKLISIEIPESVTTIGDYAFCNCSNLTNIKIPNSVTSIMFYAFAYCTNLTSIEIPNSVTSIDNSAFWNTEITKYISPGTNQIDLPNILKRAQDQNDILYTSKEFSLTNCTIEDEMIKINEDKTYAEIKIRAGKLNGLTYIISYNSWDVSVNKDNSVIAKFDNNGLLTISGTGEVDTYTPSYDRVWHNSIDEKIRKIKIENGVTSIGERSFYACDKLTSVEIPNSVTSIGDYAFYHCESLTNIEIPNSVTSIGDYVFLCCYRLTNIEVSENNTKYKDDNGVLYSKDGTEIICYPIGKEDEEYKILTGVTNIGNGAFACSERLTNIEIPNSVTSIGEGAFEECYRLTSVEIPNSVTSIGEYAFFYCVSLTNIEIPNSVTSIGRSAFSGCYSLTNIEIPNSVTTIEYYAFFNCESLTNIEIPNSVTGIGGYAFDNCESLTNVYIPKTVSYIGDEAFDGCDNLTILCHKDSTAASYAQENDINYLIIMDKIQTKTTVQQIKQQMGTNAQYKITDKNGEILTDDKQLKTGYKIEATDGENYIIIVEGDTNKDGNADIRDILAINKYRLNKANLEIESRLASDVNEDDVVDIRDILQINKFRLGKTSSL